MIVAGFGFRSGANLHSLRAAFDLARSRQGEDRPCVTHLATAQDKVAALAPLAAELGLPLCAIPPELMTAMVTPARSRASIAARGTGSVAEASALAAVTARGGSPAHIIVARQISPDRMATCALAQGTLA